MSKFLKRAAHGAQVPHEKRTSDCETVTMPVPSKIVLSMAQHIGAPAAPAVAKGDQVYVGTVVGKAGGFVSSDIHSGVSGTVDSITTITAPNGAVQTAVVIIPDGEQKVDPAIAPPVVTDLKSFQDAVRASGLVGLGGAGFPTDVKLQPKDPVDTLLINASECEVWLTSDTQEMLNCADDIVRGIEAVLKYTGIPKCVIGIENNKPECIDLLCQKTKDKPAIEVKPLPSVYGTGAELILIEKCLGREVPHGGLPADAGAIVMNVTSVSTLGKYLATGMPVVSRCITVDGDACAKPQNVVVPVGTSYQDIIDFAGVKGTLGKVVAGGAMMGPAVENLSYPTTKTTSGLIMLSDTAAQPAPVSPCIRCGRCVEYCPMGLEPVEVNQAYAARDVQELGKLHVDYCFNCGSCTFVCPAKRPCTQMMGLAKAFYLGEIKKGGNK